MASPSLPVSSPCASHCTCMGAPTEGCSPSLAVQRALSSHDGEACSKTCWAWWLRAWRLNSHETWVQCHPRHPLAVSLNLPSP